MPDTGLQTPVLFLIFNRPGNTQLVFDAIRLQKPKYLYIAADGPRAGAENEAALCATTREVASSIDWDCEVKTLFREQNLGCKMAVSTAITWFFEQVEEGIILEDDCLPHQSFFKFCTQLLDRYRTDSRVMAISGSNLLGKPWKSETQSYFWAHGGIWGWATWKRAWDLYDIEMKGWPDPHTKALVRKNIQTEEWYQFYNSMFESSFNGSLDTWDLQWFYTILVNNGLAINPAVNLVKNIGFGAGTHTNSDSDAIAKLDFEAMPFPLLHPDNKTPDADYLRLMYQALNPVSNNKYHFLKKIRAYFR